MTHVHIINSIHPTKLDNILQTINSTLMTLQHPQLKQDKKFLDRKTKQVSNDNIVRKHKFYTRFWNLTSINFDEYEISVLRKQLRYNILYNNSDHVVEE